MSSTPTAATHDVGESPLRHSGMHREVDGADGTIVWAEITQCEGQAPELMLVVDQDQGWSNLDRAGVSELITALVELRDEMG